MNIDRLIRHVTTEATDSWQLPSALSSDEVEHVVQHLKDEADRHWYIDPQISLKFAEKIVAIGHRFDNLPHLALGLMAKGNAFIYMSDYQHAWDMFTYSGELYDRLDDSIGWARTRIGRVAICIQMEQIEAALADAQRAIDIFIEQKQYDMYVRLLNNMTYVCNHQGDFKGTLQIFESIRSRSAIVDQLPQNRLANLYNNVGTAHYELGNLKSAYTFYEKVVQIDEQQNNTLGIAIGKANIGYVEMSQGRFRSALQSFHTSTEILESKRPDMYITFLIGTAECYMHLNRFDDAYDVSKMALSIARNINAVNETARLLTLVALAQCEFEQYDTAMNHLDEAEQIYSDIDASHWQSYTRLLVAQIAYMREQYGLAQQLLDKYFIHIPDGVDLNSCEARLLQIQLDIESNDFVSARNIAEHLLGIARKNKLLIVRYQVHQLCGNLSQITERNLRARRHYLAATLVMDKLQDQLTVGLRSSLIADKMNPIHFLIGQYLQEDSISLAFFHLQRIKTQVWLSFLASLDDVVVKSQHNEDGSDLDNRINELRYRQYWLYQKLSESEINAGIENVTNTPEGFAQEMETTETELRKLLEIANLKSNHGIVTQKLSTNILQDIQNNLGRNEVIVEFYTTVDQVWKIIITSSAVYVMPIKESAKKVERLIQKYQFNVKCILQTSKPEVRKLLNQQAKKLGDKLFNILLGDITDIIESRHQIYVVPYGFLHFVPFQILSDSGTYLLETHEIVTLPFSGFVLRPELNYPKNSLVFVDDWNGRLPKAKLEAETVGAMLDATVVGKGFDHMGLGHSSNGQILHIAAHSEFRLDNPDLSFIHLHEGPLYTAELLRNPFRFELVVLSACETGIAHVTSGEDLVGVGHAFLYSGADSVIASLWQVEEETTHELMQTFYRELLCGQSRAAALRQAQLTFLHNNPHSHPANLGAFQLLGNSMPLSAYNHIKADR